LCLCVSPAWRDWMALLNFRHFRHFVWLRLSALVAHKFLWAPLLLKASTRTEGRGRVLCHGRYAISSASGFLRAFVAGLSQGQKRGQDFLLMRSQRSNIPLSTHQCLRPAVRPQLREKRVNRPAGNAINHQFLCASIQQHRSGLRVVAQKRLQ